MNLGRKTSWSATILISIVTLLSSAPALCDPAVSIGGTCNGTEGNYVWITSSRTSWSTSSVFAVPVDTVDPEEWPESGAFESQLSGILPTNPTVTQYADAVAAIWGQYFADGAYVLIRLKRTLSTTTRSVECVSGLWTVASTADGTDLDESGWLKVGEGHYDVGDSSSVTALTSDIQNAITELNAEPGSDTSAFDTFIKQE